MKSRYLLPLIHFCHVYRSINCKRLTMKIHQLEGAFMNYCVVPLLVISFRYPECNGNYMYINYFVSQSGISVLYSGSYGTVIVKFKNGGEITREYMVTQNTRCHIKCPIKYPLNDELPQTFGKPLILETKQFFLEKT